MNTARVTLGGVPLSLRPGETHAWSLTSGTQPFTRVFQMSNARAQLIFERAQKQTTLGSFSGTRTRDRNAAAGPLELRLEMPGRPAVVIRGLYVVQQQAGDDPLNTTALLVSDRRWLWRRELAERSYNIRRRTPDRRLVSGALVPVQVAQNAPDYVYRRATMDNGKPWTARRVLEDVLLELCGRGGFVLGSTPFQDSIEGLVLRDSGAAALDRVLGFLPGVQVKVHEDGKVYVGSSLDQSELAMVKALGPTISGSWKVVDRSLARPRRFFGYLDREQELRFDYDEDSQGSTTISPGREPLWLQNVIPVPDPTLTLPDGTVVAQGTWLTVDAILEAWEAEGNYPADVGAISQADIRRWYLMGMSLLHHTYSLATYGQADPVWTRRLNALQDHWRRTYRVLPQWMDKIRELRAYRVAIVDEENGLRARAEAFMDYTVRPSWKSLAKRTRPKLGWEVTGWAADLTDAAVSPAEVQVLDSDNGIIQVTLRPDPVGIGTNYVPGHIDGDIPSGRAGDLVVLWNQVGLDSGYKLAVVLSAVQDVPNSEKRLHREEVKPEAAAKILPGVSSVGTCAGADWHAFVGEETARYAWLDSRESAIREAFYSGKAPPAELLVNPKRVRAVAEAQAARIYALLLDRAEGNPTWSLTGGLNPTGNAQAVTHQVTLGQDRRLVMTTTVSMPPLTLPPDVWALMPESARRTLRALVQQ